MWDRKELKARGKAAFKANYWKCVLVALILFAITGGAAAASSRRSSDNSLDPSGAYFFEMEDFDFDAIPKPFLGLAGGAAAAAALIALCVDIFLCNPLEVGCRSFFLRNSEQSAELDELGRAFQPAWMHNVVTLLLRDVFLGLWFALLVVPGIIKCYSYRMVPYIQAEHPDMSGTEAITLSRRMMNGHKWDAFVFDLSFIGWYILAGFTAGIVGVFYVMPYKSAADAELYRAISDGFFGGADTTAFPDF